MAEDLIELGFEGVDFVTDKYYDTIYDGIGRVRPWINSRHEKYRARSRSKKRASVEVPAVAPAAVETPAAVNQQDITPPKSPKLPKSPRMQEHEHRQPGRYDRNDWHSDEERERRRRRRERDRDSGYYDEKGKVEEWARRSQGVITPPPNIRIDKAEDSHIYPPPPQPMQPPYPTAGQLLPMPPDAPYPLQRSHSHNAPDPRSRSVIPYDDGQGQAMITRSRSANYGRPRERSWSRDRGRDSSLDRGYRRRSGHGHRDIDNPGHSSRHFNHVTAGIAGAIAGGFIGKEVSKGDMTATLAGVVVGALGAGVAEREWERHRGRHRREEDRWESTFGRR